MPRRWGDRASERSVEAFHFPFAFLAAFALCTCSALPFPSFLVATSFLEHHNHALRLTSPPTLMMMTRQPANQPPPKTLSHSLIRIPPASSGLPASLPSGSGTVQSRTVRSPREAWILYRRHLCLVLYNLLREKLHSTPHGTQFLGRGAEEPRSRGPRFDVIRL